ncbi:NTE family protein rssA [Methylosinus sporium]|uniref:NTE family protein rssA n=1 Tax=Methylosinus sporium TaxID=428 RepID=A0A549T975_METSR|nr:MULTISPECIES: patatin-like phospholipase family protein [Methylosinus]MBU3889675.1 patatin-like phospholipase family protein [Methylosinus sp. KRF6]TRL38417.1 NTE family protein rssA [Methylosinus sporium]
MTAFFRNPFDRWAPDGGGGVDAPPIAREPTPPPATARPKIGLALGAGAARGWSHIGVLRELAAHGIVPDVVAGTSIGAVVGACYAAGKLDAVEAFARSMTKRRVFTFMDISFSGMSLIGGERLRAALEKELTDLSIEDLPLRFAAVATEVGTGHEVWLKRGALAPAVRASYALPGIFEPVRIGDRWLFDGALVNPIPITVCRALGADFVIAVNVTADTMYRSHVIHDHHAHAAGGRAKESAPFVDASEPGLAAHLLPRYFQRRPGAAPNVAASMIDAFNIIQDRILRSRMAGDPPDATIHARHEDVGMFDFHRAEELIELGHEATKRSLPNIFAHIPLVGATP